MGHSLGEYGALVAAGVLPFEEALEAVSARGREMAEPRVDDHGHDGGRLRAARGGRGGASAQVDGYVVIANVNSTHQAVIGGATEPVERAVAALQPSAATRRCGCRSATPSTPRSSRPPSEPLRAMLRRLDVAPPQIPVVANVDGEFYPTRPGRRGRR